MNFPPRQHKGSGGKYLKLEAGAPPIKGVFAGEPFLFTNHFLGAGKSSGECLGDGCPHCAAGIKASDRFKINFIVWEDNQYVAKTFEFNSFTYDSLSELHNAGYDLSKNLVQLSKVGSGTQSKVLVIPVPNVVLSTQQQEDIARVPLNALAPFIGKPADPSGNFSNFGT